MQDQILNELADATDDVANKIQETKDHAVFILGTHLIDNGTDEPSVRTFINAAGFFGILAEGLYSELRDQLENGNATIFAAFRDVIRDLEDDLGIRPDQEFEQDANKNLLH